MWSRISLEIRDLARCSSARVESPDNYRKLKFSCG